VSFILDALKKADRRRPQGAVPDLHAQHFRARRSSRWRSRLTYLLAALVMINALAFGGLYYYLITPGEETLQVRREEGSAGPGARADNQNSVSSAATPEALMPPAQPSSPFTENVRQPDTPIEAAALNEHLRPREPESQVPEKSLASAPLPEEGPSPKDVPVASSAVELPAPQVRPFAELPPAVRAELPGFVFSMHSFTREPQGRLVRVNGRILREGQALRKDLVLREVTAQGAVFAYRGYLFEVDGF